MSATFAVGTWWMYIGVHVFSGAPAWVALGLIIRIWTGIMAAYHAALGYLSTRWLPTGGAWRWLVALPGLWLVIKWLRGWFCSGFSWLSLGYTQTGYLVVRLRAGRGVYGISALLLLGAGALVALLRGSRRCARRGSYRVVGALADWLGAATRQLDALRPGPSLALRYCRRRSGGSEMAGR